MHQFGDGINQAIGDQQRHPDGGTNDDERDQEQSGIELQLEAAGPLGQGAVIVQHLLRAVTHLEPRGIHLAHGIEIKAGVRKNGRCRFDLVCIRLDHDRIARSQKLEHFGRQPLTVRILSIHGADDGTGSLLSIGP